MTIGARLRRERTRARLSQAQLADAMGVATNYVWMVENGHRKPSRSMIERWSAATGAGAADLMIEGPALFDVSFDVSVSDPFTSRRVLDHLPPTARMVAAVWPDVGDRTLRVRARASALGRVVDLVGVDVPGIGVLPAPTVQPVHGADDLVAWIRATTEDEAIVEVKRRLGLARTRGSVSVTRVGHMFLARVVGLAESGSMRLQELVEGSPIGLFVPEML